MQAGTTNARLPHAARQSSAAGLVRGGAARAAWVVAVMLSAAGCHRSTTGADTDMRVLGRDVTVHFAADVSPGERAAIGSALASAAGLLDRHAAELGVEARYAIAQIHQISVTSSTDTCLGETGGHSMKLSVSYMHTASTAWLASLIGHEGQHFVDRGKYTGADAWKDEQEASRIQLGIGKAIGFNATEISYLEGWLHADHSIALQQHMKQGYPRNCKVGG